MPSSIDDDIQVVADEVEVDQLEVELETESRAERPNFLTATRFVDFDLPPEIIEGLDKAGFEYCTPIQAQAIPVAMSGLDIAGQAQTGTGKTTAFLVPLLNRLLTGKPLETGVPRAIIVTPTRELALQIYEDAQVLSSATSLKQVLVIGGMDYKEQAEMLSAAPEIVICTPGRVIDYLQQGVFKTAGIEVAVVDEADRLLDMGFIKDLKYLLGRLPSFTQRQTMLFSATLDDRVLELTYQFMNPPQFITAEPDKSTKINIVQEMYYVGREEKLSLLMGLLRREDHQKVIIFVNTKSGVEWLSKKLTLNGFQAEGITGDLPQPKRLKLMESFKEDHLQILVATDVASRGIHVDDVSHVYNYDLPQDAENYVHRIGRTARAGNAGKAVSFGCEDYVFHLEPIENLLGEKIPVSWAESELYQEDQGGEVRLKERRGGGDRDRKKSFGRGAKGSDGGGSPARPMSRGPAKSQRIGGIFGLSPRLAGEGSDQQDVRQVLIWAVSDDRPVEILAGPSSQDVADVASTGGDLAEFEGKPSDRKRKRRRGRRGRDAVEVATGVVSVLSGEETSDGDIAGAPHVGGPDVVETPGGVSFDPGKGDQKTASATIQSVAESDEEPTQATVESVEAAAKPNKYPTQRSRRSSSARNKYQGAAKSAEVTPPQARATEDLEKVTIAPKVADKPVVEVADPIEIKKEAAPSAAKPPRQAAKRGASTAAKAPASRKKAGAEKALAPKPTVAPVDSAPTSSPEVKVAEPTAQKATTRSTARKPAAPKKTVAVKKAEANTGGEEVAEPSKKPVAAAAKPRRTTASSRKKVESGEKTETAATETPPTSGSVKKATGRGTPRPRKTAAAKDKSVGGEKPESTEK